MIMNLQLQKNTLQKNIKQNNSNKVILQQVTIKGKHNWFNISKYCWSHGVCVHSSENCRKKKDGLKNSAPFANKMGGSLDFCHKWEWLIGSDKLKCNNVTSNCTYHDKNKLLYLTTQNILSLR